MLRTEGGKIYLVILEILNGDSYCLYLLSGETTASETYTVKSFIFPIHTYIYFRSPLLLRIQSIRKIRQYLGFANIKGFTVVQM